MKTFSVLLLVSFTIQFCITFGSVLKTHDKIVGGEIVNIEQFPYQVAVLDVDNQICGGSIISDRWILTAAHCTDDTIPRYLTVRVGSSFHQHGGVVHQVDSVVQHPDHVPYSWLTDFALLQLTTALDFRLATVQPIPLASSDSDLDFDFDCVISGWGKTLNDSQSTDQLRAAQVRLVPQEQCNGYYDGKVDEETMVCAGEAGRDSCQGDSGGPLIGRGKQVGIVSWGKGCGDYPGVYANVVFARGWIRSVTGY
ncbi:trypsin-7-like [Aedes albopictus]|uniref:trypsin n=1 Tax=Aedes albopictus TaxID=7160 RepID=A0ABM1ZLW5_AEDAL|nr:trypsin-7-like [Aedes albopictus]